MKMTDLLKKIHLLAILNRNELLSRVLSKTVTKFNEHYFHSVFIQIIMKAPFSQSLFIYCFQTRRPKSNLTGHFASTSVSAPRTTLTLMVMRWTFICLRLKKPKPRPLSWWGYVSFPHTTVHLVLNILENMLSCVPFYSKCFLNYKNIAFEL